VTQSLDFLQLALEAEPHQTTASSVLPRIAYFCTYPLFATCPSQLAHLPLRPVTRHLPRNELHLSTERDRWLALPASAFAASPSSTLCRLTSCKPCWS